MNRLRRVTKPLMWFMALLLAALTTGCGGGGQSPILGGGGGGVPGAAVCIPAVGATKAITAFSLAGAAGVINEAAKTIAVTVPAGTNVTALVATFVTNGTSVKVGTVTQTSTVTANNFTNPVTYTVTAADCTTVNYIVTVTVSILPVAVCADITTPLPLGTANSYAVLAGTALTLTNPQVITGDVGSPSITPAGGPSTLIGTMHDAGTDPNPGVIQTAVTDMQTAFTCATVTRACSVGAAFNFAAAQDFAALPQPLAAGHYCVTGAMSVGSNLTLTNPGIYIFQSTGALDTAVGPITVSYGGAATSANTSVYWVPGGIATLQANVTFLGSILSNAAAINVGANSTLIPGRVLSGAAVNLTGGTNTITRPVP
jgi:hypothetical protein